MKNLDLIEQIGYIVLMVLSSLLLIMYVIRLILKYNKRKLYIKHYVPKGHTLISIFPDKDNTLLLIEGDSFLLSSKELSGCEHCDFYDKSYMICCNHKATINQPLPCDKNIHYYFKKI